MPSSREARDKSETYHHGNLRRALLEAARAILAGEGLDALSLRAVARRAGVSHAAPYHHFPDKESLLAAVAEQGFRELNERLLAGAADESDTERRLAAFGDAYLRFASEHPALFRLMLGPRFGERNRHPDVTATAEVGYNLLLDTARAWSSETGGGREHERTVAAAFWCLVHGLAELLIDGKINAALDPVPGSELMRASEILSVLSRRGVPPRD